MKKRKLPVFLLLTMVGLLMISCNKDALDVTEEFDLRTSIVVSDNHADFVGEHLLDALAESEMIDNYASVIKSIEIIEVTYYVSDLTGTITQQINSGTLEVADPDGANSMVISTMQNVNLMQATTEQTIVFDQAAIDKLASLIKNDPHQAMVYLRGDVNETPVDFTVVVNFRVKMVAGVL